MAGRFDAGESRGLEAWVPDRAKKVGATKGCRCSHRRRRRGPVCGRIGAHLGGCSRDARRASAGRVLRLPSGPVHGRVHGRVPIHRRLCGHIPRRAGHVPGEARPRVDKPSRAGDRCEAARVPAVNSGWGRKCRPPPLGMQVDGSGRRHPSLVQGGPYRVQKRLEERRAGLREQIDIVLRPEGARAGILHRRAANLGRGVGRCGHQSPALCGGAGEAWLGLRPGGEPQRRHEGALTARNPRAATLFCCEWLFRHGEGVVG
eukprot:scaffold3909_cov117-Isochrysis_galbana.AAC.7